MQKKSYFCFLKDKDMYKGLLIISRGIGQVMFQNNALSGIFILVGILCNSWILALLALVGNIASTLTAYFLHFSRNEIQNGLYGFNGTLVGIAIGVFLKINLWSIVFLLVGSALSTYIFACFSRQNKLPGYTSPFIFAVWILLLIGHHLFPALLLPSESIPMCQTVYLFDAFSLNIGQVMFQGDSVLSGLFFLCGILLNSRVHAIYAVLGAAIPLSLALLPETNYTLFNAGMLGYNSVLCSIAVGQNALTLKSMIGAMFVILLSIGLQEVGLYMGFVTLTAPFVLSVWIYMIMKKALIQITSRHGSSPISRA